jgi:uncharacterized protein YciI
MLGIRGALVLALLTPCLLAAQSDDYYMVFLRPRPDRKPLAKEEGERIQAAHMDNIRAMAKRGVLVAAGPFDDTPHTISGVFLFRLPSLEEAKRIAAEDPTVIEHRNNVEVYGWRAPKGIGEEYVRLHAADPKTPEDMGVQPFCLLYRVRELSEEQKHDHARYLQKLASEGKLAAAGPVANGGELQDIVVFQRIGDESAQKLINDDPAVKAGALRLEYHHWWCSAHVLPGGAGY